MGRTNLEVCVVATVTAEITTSRFLARTTLSRSTVELELNEADNIVHSPSVNAHKILNWELRSRSSRSRLKFLTRLA
jgi:hypothetical protein